MGKLTKTSSLGNISSLIGLDIAGNNFYGVLPSFAQASNLKSLKATGNKLVGRLPRALANCSRLEVLYLGNNMINDTFPVWLEQLPALKILSLRANKFYGQIEQLASLMGYPMLQILDLSSKQFSDHLSKEFVQGLKAMLVVNSNKSEVKYIGSETDCYESPTITSKGIDLELERILTIFTFLDISNNNFRGEILPEIGSLKELKLMNLSQNGFTGLIPPSLAELSELESLDLSQNQLSREIPPQHTSLTFLSVMNLSYNQLEGIIPRGDQFGTFTNASYEGNPGLCGWPLTRNCGEANETKVPLVEEEEDSRTTSIFDWKIVSMDYAWGPVIGFSTGYTILSHMRHKWFSSLEKQRRQRGRRSSQGKRRQRRS